MSFFATTAPRCRRVVAHTPFRILLSTPQNLCTRSTTRSALPRRLFASKPRPPHTPPPPAKKPSLPQNGAVAKPPAPNKPAPLSFSGVKGSTPPTPDSSRSYPSDLLIYHAGTGRIVFIAAVRLTGIFILAFFATVIAPRYYFSPLEPTWMAFAFVAAGALPLTITTLTTAPFVCYIHLFLPAWARSSSARLQRYAAQLPSTAAMEITTLRWVFPRKTRLTAGELYFKEGAAGLGPATLRRNVPAEVGEAAGRKWYAWRPLTRFYVAGKGGGKVGERGIWEAVVGCVVRGWRAERRW